MLKATRQTRRDKINDITNFEHDFRDNVKLSYSLVIVCHRSLKMETLPLKRFELMNVLFVRSFTYVKLYLF